MEIVAPLLVALLSLALIIVLNERYALLSTDHFATPTLKWAAYAWLGLLLLVITSLVAMASVAQREIDLANLEFWSLFSFHVILMVFLAGWWLLTGRPDIRRFMNLQHESPSSALLIGIAVGVGGWAITIALAIGIGALLMQMGIGPDEMTPSPVIPWMAALPVWKKAVLIFSAMTVEELFFRGWLQKRVGLILSTVVFALAHAGYGQPFMLIGITIVSLIIGYTFYRTKNLWPCIVAHGVFDAIQLFVIVPLALRISGMEMV